MRLYISNGPSLAYPLMPLIPSLVDTSNHKVCILFLEPLCSSNTPSRSVHCTDTSDHLCGSGQRCPQLLAWYVSSVLAHRPLRILTTPIRSLGPQAYSIRLHRCSDRNGHLIQSHFNMFNHIRGVVHTSYSMVSAFHAMLH